MNLGEDNRLVDSSTPAVGFETQLGGFHRGELEKVSTENKLNTTKWFVLPESKYYNQFLSVPRSWTATDSEQSDLLDRACRRG